MNRVVIGRQETGGLQQVHVDLSPFHAREMGVSRRHAVIYRMKNSLYMEDLNSANGSYLNGQRLMPGQPHLIRNGDEVRFGKFCCYIEFV
jgi:predicted component of type VI protein secretion system